MRVHYLPRTFIWAVCGTPHDRKVTEDLSEVTCLNCRATGQFRRDLDRLHPPAVAKRKLAPR